MGYIFLPSQIAEMAMDVEAAGITFYRRLKDLTEDKRIQEVLGFLSVQEAEHRVKFLEIAKAIKLSDEPYDYVIDVREILKNQLDKIKQKALSFDSVSLNNLNLKEVLNIAINLEKESIRTYVEISKSFSNIFHDAISKIIKEEEKHLEMLINASQKLPV
ncbi:MAG TPA: ferritin family protein [Candidatus Omnitrophota bacterium]|nr:ferritin family protein [Candidatus Omnitrophota bacterium]HPN88842.1 ferritin family protein [Candidatus Omnitrophota bacterium]